MKPIAKLLSLSCVCISLLTLTTTASLAQTKNSRGTNQKVNRSAKVDPALAQASKLTHQARVHLKAGLPVYDGHRVLSLEITELVMKDLRMAHSNAKQATALTSARTQVQQLGKPKESAQRRYSAQEIAVSNKHLVNARADLVQARNALKNVRVDTVYASHAQDLLTFAIQEIDYALAYVNAR